jgi:chromosome segregation protein
LRFHKLRLTGFKSFVDPTELVIGDGLTGVVGPNGCGKSNLLEALRWVMGENRPTAMRGGGMEDVIFAGAASRAARNFAEVALQIDNRERLAPAGFNDSDDLEITRRITRDLGSAYRLNGKEARARDVTMLFADAATGAHSPALVRQGQISELINAKPKARRRVLEDAAGIAGLYQRRHEAELKLKATEANLARIEDLIDSLVSQRDALERQARQAARYRAIGTDLRRAEGLLLARLWREADTQRVAAEAALREATLAAAQSERAVRAATEARAQAEKALPPVRDEALVAAAVLQRLAVERDTLSAEAKRAEQTIADLRATLKRLEGDRAREAALDKDAAQTIADLDAEARALADAGDGHDAVLEAAHDKAAAASAALTQQEATLEALTEEAARQAARHQSAQRLRDDCAATLNRAEAATAKARQARAAATDTLNAAREAEAQAVTRAAQATKAAETADAALGQAEAARAEAQTAEAEARAARAEAEGEMSALTAEADALARLVARDGGQKDQLLDRLRVTPGFEKALGAALADELRAAEVAGDGPTGWRRLPEYDTTPPLPAGCTPLAEAVEAPAVLARRLSQVGVVDASAGAALQPALQPGQRLVSRDGALWRWDGYAVRAEDQPSAAALRLEQANRLAALQAERAALETRLSETRATHDAAAAALAETSTAEKTAREARRAADAAQTAALRDAARAEAERDRAQGQLETLGLTQTRHEAEAADARTALTEAEAALDALEDPAEARAAVETARAAVEMARTDMLAAREAFDALRRAGEARKARLTAITRERAGWAARLDQAQTLAAELSGRHAEAEAALSEALGAPDRLADAQAKLAKGIAEAEARKAEADNAQSVAEAALRDATQAEREAEKRAGEARERRAGLEARAEAARDTARAAIDRIEEDRDCTPDALLAVLEIGADELAGISALEDEINSLKRARDALGAVNLRAEEDAHAVEEERAELAREKADLDQAIATLRGGIGSLNREGRERLLTAFEQVNRNFGMLFTHLFGGGEASLVMVESDDPLEAGLEIMCQPPGKKLSTLSLLSGGEQTLTALALIFAVFLANPAPICVLDEVDAPLDDANVTRFCDMLDEMCRRTDTRFLIITHHAVTMARMDRLFGVTMQEQGVSQLVSVDLKRAETLVA